MQTSIDVIASNLVTEASISQQPLGKDADEDRTNEFVTALLKAALLGVLRHNDQSSTDTESPNELESSARLLAKAIARLSQEERAAASLPAILPVTAPRNTDVAPG